MELGNVILSNKNQTLKIKGLMFSLIYIDVREKKGGIKGFHENVRVPNRVEKGMERDGGEDGLGRHWE